MTTPRHTSTPLYLLAAVVGGLLWSAPRAPGLTLVADGAPRAMLIVEADAPKSLEAAEALRTYLERMSGARLPLVIEGEALPDPAPPGRVHVGHTAAARGQHVSAGFDQTVRADLFEEEGYVLRTLNDHTLLVAGNNDGPYNGTVYAAYALLEALGCRWYFPGEWGEIIPEHTTVSVPPLDLVSRPDFAVRGVAMLGWAPGAHRTMHYEWSLKVGMQDRQRISMYPTAGDGFLAMLLPPAEYAESNPEFYAMNQQGNRTVTPKTGVHHAMLCLSNPEVLAESIRNLRLAFAGEKRIRAVDAMGVGLSPPDGTPFCYCPDCEKASQNFRFPEYYAERFMIEDVNADIDALKEDFYQTFFGPAAGPHVRAWWDACAEALGKAENHAHEDFLINHIYTTAFVDRIRPHVAAALAADATPVQRERLDAFALMAEHLDRYAAMNAAMQALDYAAAAEANERMTEIFHALDEIYPLFVDRKHSIADRLRAIAAKLDGSAGDLAAALPLEMRFARDPFNEGMLADWYRPEFDDVGWSVKNTFYTWEQQDPPDSPRGHAYAGYGWYRAGVQVDEAFSGREMRLFVGGAINEAWVWVNGRYIGTGRTNSGGGAPRRIGSTWTSRMPSVPAISIRSRSAC